MKNPKKEKKVQKVQKVQKEKKEKKEKKVQKEKNKKKIKKIKKIKNEKRGGAPNTFDTTHAQNMLDALTEKYNNLEQKKNEWRNIEANANNHITQEEYKQRL